MFTVDVKQRYNKNTVNVLIEWEENFDILESKKYTGVKIFIFSPPSLQIFMKLLQIGLILFYVLLTLPVRKAKKCKMK